MTCAATAVQCPMRRLSNAQASCSSRTAPSTRSQHFGRLDVNASASVCRSQRQRLQPRNCRCASYACAATASSQRDPAEGAPAGGADGDEVILSKEDDWVVPGGANDSLSSNTQLGRAVQDACKELETLGGLEQETLEKANALLQKLGYRVVEKQDEGEGAQE